MKLTSNQFYRIKSRHDLMFAMIVDILLRKNYPLIQSYHIAREVTTGRRENLL